jgi:AAA+ superfamily predicted ATPase
LVKKDAGRLNALFTQWETSAETRRIYQKEALSILLSQKNEYGKEDTLTLPAALHKLDAEKGTNYLGKVVNSIYQFAQIIVKADGDISMQEMESLSKIWQLLHSYKIPETVVPSSTEKSSEAPKEGAKIDSTPAPEETLEMVLEELNKLVGMATVKESIQTLTNFLKVQKVRQDRGLAKTSVSLHSVFSGPPGTGKTTVARLISRIYKALGFLEKGHLVETDRAGMVADYIGGTSKKVDEKVTAALDGVLFIDEAYALTPEDSSRDFGQEAVDVLLKRMEDHRSRLVVIAAGYTDEMIRFVESNPGLKSRFNRYFYFDNYTPDELVAIFAKMCKESHFHPTDAANQKLKTLLTQLYEQRDRTFGNARLVRNLFEKTIERQANRLAVINTLTDEILTTLTPDDIPSPDLPPVPSPAAPPPAAAATSPDSESPDSESPDPESPDPESWLPQFSELLNQALQPMGTIAKIRLKDNALQIVFESDALPSMTEMASLTVNLLKRSPVSEMTDVQLYGYIPKEDFPEWSQNFDLTEAS